ncbi:MULTISPECIES: hypothetical protein [Pseudoalteromonas]|uniref:Uncharacterized protein n=1 Tax=Pseudoalteromonas luteoviolacea (strain 2ta16) TaxID=1353533 RepID=V4H048_PSEL2|nr:MULTISPECIES: hypothetical protein [Pseudoalteromonas]ESP90791.1 hypothetical protein PL2TA16_01895 [Pseudoalteromonas luteoviolacea 2ta16]KZN41634.1 hypothetical protein N483_13275 [Pseudoalteromonas luteoviolacea NCIMB 1944]MCG7548203.1 hypothetical protein [Pseudoalteromonas sp. Of7M-16]
MLNSDSLNYIYYVIGQISTPVFFIALIAGWKSVNTRSLLLILLVVEAIDTLVSNIALSWQYNFYLWIFFYSLVYIYVVFARRLIAIKLSPHFKFFDEVRKNYYFSKQEGGLIFVYACASLFLFINLIEIKLYQYGVLGSLFIVEQLFSPALTLLYLVEALLLLRLSIRTLPVDND